MTFLLGLLKPFALKLLMGVAIAGAIAAVLMGARNAGRNAERVDVMRKTLEIKNAQAEAAANRPRTRDDLVDRLRRHEF